MIVALCVLLAARDTHAATAIQLAWTANTEADLAGYVLVWGTSPGVYTHSVVVAPTAVTQQVTDLSPGTYYFALRAFNTAGLESAHSNEVAAVVAPTVLPPTIVGLSPSAGTTTGGTDVTITGARFQHGAIVRFGTAVGTVQQLTATAMTVRAPAGTAGPVPVSIINPDSGAATADVAFVYHTPPSITAVSPVVGPMEGGTDLVVTGAAFQAGALVRFGADAGVVQQVTATSISVRAPAHARGAVDVSIVNPDGGVAMLGQAFTYRGPMPSIANLSPKSGPSAGGTELALDGANFEAGLTVSVDGVAAAVISMTPTRVLVRMPAHAPTRVRLAVTNPDGQSAWGPGPFTYTSAAPTIAAITPDRGAVEKGNVVTVTGTGFVSGGTVSFDGRSATVLAVTSTSITVVAPAHASGIVGVIVRNVDGQRATRADGYTYLATAPLITKVFPAAGSVAGGTRVTVTGLRFGQGPTVVIGGLAVPVLASSSTTVTVETPAHVAGPVDIALTFADGQAMSAHARFTYEDASPTFTRYFADGASGRFFQTRFALANAHSDSVPVTVTFTDAQGTAISMGVVLPPTSRMTIDDSNRPALATDRFSTRFEAPQPVAIERTMTWAAGGPVYGAHSDVGVAAPRTSWVMAEGTTTDQVNTFYLVQNPTTTTADVQVQFFPAGGQQIDRTYPVAPQSVTSIWVNKVDAALADAAVSARITSRNNVPVVVERSAYLQKGAEVFSGGENSAAVEAPATRWYLAEGATGGTFDAFVVIANLNGSPVDVRVTYLRGGMAPIVRTHSVATRSRLTLCVDEEAPELADTEVAIIVESLSTKPVVVERTMRWRASASSDWIGAHASRGATAMAARWLVADGEAGGPGEAVTYVLVANPTSNDTPVRFTLLTEAGTTHTTDAIVSAQGRYSLNVASAFPDAVGTRFSVVIESADGSASLVVERSSYTSTPTTPWAAGTNSPAVAIP
ncbi:IPT/TIG domain-containing protein [Luteitalea sp.]